MLLVTSSLLYVVADEQTKEDNAFHSIPEAMYLAVLMLTNPHPTPTPTPNPNPDPNQVRPLDALSHRLACTPNPSPSPRAHPNPSPSPRAHPNPVGETIS